ncbi:MAG: alpha/beta fold hydrolase [Cyanobacteria bacterium P01_F01_bin.53]
MEFYTWQDYRCAFEKIKGQGAPALLLIHPIGVGLSREFWQPFIQQWGATNEPRGTVYNVDLLGCGKSDMPARAYSPKDWAEQLAYFIEQVAKEPVVLVVQGALLPVAVELINSPSPAVKDKIKGMVLSGPPAWRLMTTPTESWKQTLAWSFFSSPLGNAFYRYARREKFLDSFSKRQLFERAEDVTAGWLSMLHKGSRDLNSRYAVFSFLAGFWRQDYASAIAQIQQPVMIVMGNTASTIDRTTAQQENNPETMTQQEAGKQRLQAYLDHFPRAQGVNIVGRNVLPYESAEAFAQAIAPFVTAL